jgi:hypothetical protein
MILRECSDWRICMRDTKINTELVSDASHVHFIEVSYALVGASCSVLYSG